jgi:hypothetical protein
VILELGPLQVLANIVLECPNITLSISGYESSPPGPNEPVRPTGSRPSYHRIAHADRDGQAKIVRVSSQSELDIGHDVAIARI